MTVYLPTQIGSYIIFNVTHLLLIKHSLEIISLSCILVINHPILTSPPLLPQQISAWLHRSVLRLGFFLRGVWVFFIFISWSLESNPFGAPITLRFSSIHHLLRPLDNWFCRPSSTKNYMAFTNLSSHTLHSLVPFDGTSRKYLNHNWFTAQHICFGKKNFFAKWWKVT